MLALMAVGLALLSTTGCAKLQARDQLNKGVQSYKNAKYEEAINHFQEAVEARSHAPERAPLSGDRLRATVHSGRRHS